MMLQMGADKKSSIKGKKLSAVSGDTLRRTTEKAEANKISDINIMHNSTDKAARQRISP